MSKAKTMVKALRVLSKDIQSGDGVANACVADAADMIEDMSAQLAEANERIESAKNLFAQMYQVLGAHDANVDAMDAALAASGGDFDFEICPYIPDGEKERC